MVIVSKQEAHKSLTEPKTMIVDIYCRSASQDGNTLAAQESACRQFAKDAGFTVGEVYAEIASGVSLEREQLALLRKRYLAGEIQGVVVCTLDRLSRSAPDLLALQEEMAARHVTLYGVTETVVHLYQNPEDFLLKGSIFCQACHYRIQGRYITNVNQTVPDQGHN